ncbi:MAG: nuclear transport factor 2 family protein [Gammaproteobacteria bacterium]|nr:nuclear transport factor 2 family protein [Gammaproteobacteria bacterium]MBU2678583.1 nuclear transport factor 2 family protein [Gammaproteobacteria bacterium]NNC57549.1 nuclear transport factor 2 family protein [Woeseiaceae bacterium]NNL52317.1 nuclear transport factor 2 family protein [Woeseiaceae bacterium]
MKNLKALGLAVLGTLLLGSVSALAQTPTDDRLKDEADVWAQVERQWTAQEKGDKRWIDQQLTDNFSGWGKASPAPRNKASTKMWNRFNEQVSQMVTHELYPLSIIVHEDVAIAHYLYSSATKDKTRNGEFETNNGRYTDILVRTDDGWKFIAWAGGSDD